MPSSVCKISEVDIKCHITHSGRGGGNGLATLSSCVQCVVFFPTPTMLIYFAFYNNLLLILLILLPRCWRASHWRTQSRISRKCVYRCAGSGGPGILDRSSCIHPPPPPPPLPFPTPKPNFTFFFFSFLLSSS